jgi:hypothetical protein
MDERPVFEFKMLDIKESAVEELKKFSKSIFDLDYILNTDSELKYTREIKKAFTGPNARINRRVCTVLCIPSIQWAYDVGCARAVRIVNETGVQTTAK